MATQQQAIDALNAAATAYNTRIASIDAKVAQATVDLAALNAEEKSVISITMLGDINTLYPVWWRPDFGASATTKITIARGFGENAATVGTLLGLKNSSHVYGAFAEIECRGYPWCADPSFLQIKRFAETYDVGISHLQQAMFCDPANGSTANADLTHNGCYLRGGGVTYHFTTNDSALVINYQDGSGGNALVTEIYSNGADIFRVSPIALGTADTVTGLFPNIQTPAADLLSF